MKPKEISREEFIDIYKTLENKTVELSEKYFGSDNAYWQWQVGHFISHEYTTCFYLSKNKIPKSFRTCKKDGIYTIIHFLPKPCDQVKMTCKIEAICLCTTQDGKYYLHSHRVGRCPWKETA